MLALDFVEPLTKTEHSNHHILVVADYSTKWVKAFRLKDQKAETVVRIFMAEIISHFGVPLTLL